MIDLAGLRWDLNKIKKDAGLIGGSLTVTPLNRTKRHLDAAISYVGGRTETLFAGVYVKEDLPGLVAILTMNGLD